MSDNSHDFSKRERSSGGGGGSNSGSFERRPFLKGNDLPRDGKKVTAKIDAFRDAPRNMEFSKYLLDVTIAGRKYTIGIKSDDDVKLDRVISMLGPKTKTWPGKSIKLFSDLWQSPQGKVRVVRIEGKN